MLAISYRLIAALLFVLVANPICCCGMESAPKCCMPSDGDSSPEAPKEPGNGGCDCCQCGEEMAKPTEGAKLAGPSEVGFSPFEASLLHEIGCQPSIRDRRGSLASLCGWHSTGVPIYQRHCAFLL